MSCRISVAVAAFLLAPSAVAQAKGFHMRRWAIVLLAVFLSGCSASTQVVVRLNTGRGNPIVHILRRGVEPVAVSEQELKKAVAQLAPSVPPSERPLEHARQEKLAGALRKMFKGEGLPIEVIQVSPTPGGAAP